MEYNFPQELVENILTRLPLRSLLRFKCLSKQWYLAFSDSKKFITGQDFFLHYIDYHTPGLSRLRIPTSFDGSEGNTVEAVDVECPLAGTSNEEIICVAHCNGILCMLNHTYSQPEHYASTVIVWNPMTMERKRFQLTGGRCSWEAFGFGYDASIDDYKIIHLYDNVHIIDFEPALDVYQCRSMNVLRMKTGQWNLYRNDSLDDIPYKYRISEKNRVGTAVNGCLYWIARKCNGSVILCFELERDTLREETSLGSCNLSADSNLLGVWEDSLCLLCDFDCIHFDMWVMIEESHGVTKTKSWIKLFKFPKVEAMCIQLEPVHPVLTLNGQLLIESNIKGFFLFNPKDGLVKNIAIHGLQFPDAWFNVIPYVESLVSLNA